MTPRLRRRAVAGLAAAALLTGCLGRHFRRLEEQNQQVLKRLDGLEAHLAGFEKRLSVSEASGGSFPVTASADAGTVPVTRLVLDPLAYSGRPVRVEAVLAAPVDKDRAFFIVLNKPKDALMNVGVYYDPEDIATRRDVYLTDPGQWLAIEGQLAVDREPNGHKGYSGYALKATSVKRISK